MAWRCENGTRAQEKTKYKKSFIDSSTFCASTNEEKKNDDDEVVHESQTDFNKTNTEMQLRQSFV